MMKQLITVALILLTISSYTQTCNDLIYQHKFENGGLTWMIKGGGIMLETTRKASAKIDLQQNAEKANTIIVFVQFRGHFVEKNTSIIIRFMDGTTLTTYSGSIENNEGILLYYFKKDAKMDAFLLAELMIDTIDIIFKNTIHTIDVPTKAATRLRNAARCILRG
jgi:hypothetical protein